MRLPNLFKWKDDERLSAKTVKNWNAAFAKNYINDKSMLREVKKCFRKHKKEAIIGKLSRNMKAVCNHCPIIKIDEPSKMENF